ncbi:MAG: RNA 2',3'-cyclic phosphodiesterase [Actinomycetota bacterium]|nr:RNA 2',3'-cyclic phosphodiesterase [Actinomycetota bacterium]
MARNRAARPEAAPVRLFAAVDVPERVRVAIDRELMSWRERLPKGRWVKPENWHVTVKFMGRTYPRLVERVHQACRDAASLIRPFRVGVAGLGVFPSPRRARVLWVGLRDRDGGLPALAAALDRELVREFPPEKRAFTAHLTVARFNPPQPVTDHAQALEGARIDANPFRVGSLVLYRSHLSPKGARYEALERFALRG